MSSRHQSARFFIALSSAVLLAGGAGFAISACSSSTADSGGGTDAAPEASDSGRIKVEAGPEEPVDAAKPETTEQCQARCEMEHAKSTAKYDAVDTCWAAHCQGPCVDETHMFDAGDDAADAGTDRVTDGGGLCGSIEGSGRDIFCDDCTTQYCCAEWNGCYKDTDCLALENCYGDCP